jgi:hypothetical protein
MEGIVDVVISVLQADENKGVLSLETLITLTTEHADIWQDCIPKLLYVVS